MDFGNFFNFAAVISAFIAAYFWYRSANAKVAVDSGDVNTGLKLIGDKGEIEARGVKWIETIKTQSNWSSKAAVMAAAASAFQALG